MLSPKNCAASWKNGEDICERDEGSLTRVQFTDGTVEWFCREHAEKKACGPLDPPYVEVTCDCGTTTLVQQ